jgi:hypothetical protein
MMSSVPVRPSPARSPGEAVLVAGSVSVMVAGVDGAMRSRSSWVIADPPGSVTA